MLLIQRANESARNLQLQLERESKNRSSSFFTYLKDFFFTNPVGCDEYSLEERRKVSAYLETCLYQLSHIFEVRNVPPHVFLPYPSIIIQQQFFHTTLYNQCQIFVVVHCDNKIFFLWIHFGT